jgi:hypothetical protein
MGTAVSGVSHGLAALHAPNSAAAPIAQAHTVEPNNQLLVEPRFSLMAPSSVEGL